MLLNCIWGCGPTVKETYSLSLHQGSSLTVHVYYPVVPYMLTRLAGCSVAPEISCGARKLTRTPQVKKKKSILLKFRKSIFAIFIGTYISLMFIKYYTLPIWFSMSQAIRARTSMLVRCVSGLTNYEYSFYLSPKSLVHKGPAQSHKLTLSLLYMFFSS